MTPQQADNARKVIPGAIARKKTNATALSREMGRGKDYIRDFLSGRKESLAAGDVIAIERILGIGRARLLGEKSLDELRRVPFGQEFDPDLPLEHDENSVAAGRWERKELGPGEVPERNVIAGLGQGGVAEGVLVDGQVLDGVRAVWRLPPDFIRTELRAREGEVDFIAVDGDSMIPTLLPGDRVMINRSQTAPSPDGLYAIYDGIGISVKRLEIVKGSNPLKLRIKSDNPNHSSDEILAADLHVVGRVVCRVTRC